MLVKDRIDAASAREARSLGKEFLCLSETKTALAGHWKADALLEVELAGPTVAFWKTNAWVQGIGQKEEIIEALDEIRNEDDTDENPVENQYDSEEPSEEETIGEIRRGRK